MGSITDRRRRLGAALILLLVAVAVVGMWRVTWTATPPFPTTSQEPPGAGDVPPHQPDTELVLGVLAGVTGWNPLLHQQHPLQALLFNGLVRYNDRMQVVPDLAESWEADAQGRVYTLHLRSAQWADGQPVTATDVVFSLTVRLHPRADRLGAYNLAPLRGASAYLEQLDRLDRQRAEGILDEAQWEKATQAAYEGWLAQGAVRAVDPRTVVVQFEEPFAPALELFTLAVIPAHVFQRPEEALDPEHPFHTRAPIGSGPYRLESWVPDVRARFVAPRGPGEEEPGYRSITVRFFRDQDALDQALLAGEVDAGRISAEAARRAVEEQRPLRLVEYPDLGYTFVAYNLQDPLLADPAVRKALDLAVDRVRMVAELFDRYAQPLWTPGLVGVGWSAPDPQVPYDPDGARRLLEEAGWRDTDGDGVRERAGVPLRLELITHRENRHRTMAAEMLRDALAPVGVEVRVRLLDWSQLVADLRNRRFQAALFGVGVGVDPDGYPLWHSRGHLNFTGLQDPEVDRLLEQGRRGGDREQIYTQVQRRLSQLQPALFLWQETLVFAVARGVDGPISGSPGGFLWNIAAWHPTADALPEGAAGTAGGGAAGAGTAGPAGGP